MANLRVSKKDADFSKAAPSATRNLTVQPWDDRPGASRRLWNGANLVNKTVIPKLKTAPGADPAADYAYGFDVGRECARDFVVARDEAVLDDIALIDTVADLIHDTALTETIKRGCLAGFLKETHAYLMAGIERTHGSAKDEDKHLALFGTRGVLLTVHDQGGDIPGHLAALTKSHHALQRIVGAAAASDQFLGDEWPTVYGQAQDGLEFIGAMAAIFAEPATITD